MRNLTARYVLLVALSGLLGSACAPNCEEAGERLRVLLGESRKANGFNEHAAMCEMANWSAQRRRCIVALGSGTDWHRRCPPD